MEEGGGASPQLGPRRAKRWFPLLLHYYYIASYNNCQISVKSDFCRFYIQKALYGRAPSAPRLRISKIMRAWEGKEEEGRKER